MCISELLKLNTDSGIASTAAIVHSTW